jgi:WD40 repeat protein
MPDLFISYSRKDKEFVKRLQETLAAQGRDVWVDWEDIPPTADWRNEIHQGIANSNAFVYVISPDSVKSEVCGEELVYAVENKKRFVPLLYREIVEAEERAKVHPAVNSHNWIFARETDSFDEMIGKLASALDTDLDHVREHTRLLMRARQWEDKQRSSGFVLSGGELDEAESWLSQAINKNPEPTELHSQYIYSSRKAATRRQQRLITGAITAAVISAVLAVIAALGFIVAEQNRQEAERNAEISDSLALAANAQTELSINNNDLAIALALEAVEIDDPPLEAQRLLEAAAYAPGTRQVYNAIAGPDTQIVTAVYHPTDQSLALIGSSEGTIALLNLESSEVVQRFSGHAEDDIITNIVISDDGQRFASAGSAGMVLLWSIDSETPVAQLEGHEAAISALAFSPDGEYVLSGDTSGAIILWNAEDASEERPLESVHTAEVTEVVFAHTSFTALSSGNDNRLIRWDLESGEAEVTYEGLNLVGSVDISRDDARIVTGQGDFNVYLHDVETLEPTASLTGHFQLVNSVRFDPTGEYILSASNDNTVRLWRIDTLSTEARLVGHTDQVSAASFSPDRFRALSVSRDGEARLWDLFHASQVGLLDDHLFTVNDVAYSSDGQRAATASWDGTVRVWDMTTQDTILRPDVTLSSELAGVTPNALEFNAQGNLLLVGYEGVTLWDLEGDLETPRPLAGHDPSGYVASVAFNLDGTRALSGSSDQTMILWEIATGEIAHRFEELGGTVTGVDFSPDDARALSIAANGRVVEWDLTTYEIISEMTISGAILWGGQYMPQGDGVLVSANNDLILLDASLNEVRRFQGHTATISNAFAVSADGTQIYSAAGSPDSTLRVWDVSTSSELRRISFTGQIASIAVHPADGTLLTGLYDSSARLLAVEPPTLAETTTWVTANRTQLPFTCEQRQTYRLEISDECADAPTIASASD